MGKNSKAVFAIVLVFFLPTPLAADTAGQSAGVSERAAKYVIAECLAKATLAWADDGTREERWSQVKEWLVLIAQKRKKADLPIYYMSFDYGRWRYVTIQFADGCEKRDIMTREILNGLPGMAEAGSFSDLPDRLPWSNKTATFRMVGSRQLKSGDMLFGGPVWKNWRHAPFSAEITDVSSVPERCKVGATLRLAEVGRDSRPYWYTVTGAFIFYTSLYHVPVFLTVKSFPNWKRLSESTIPVTEVNLEFFLAYNCDYSKELVSDVFSNALSDRNFVDSVNNTVKNPGMPWYYNLEAVRQNFSFEVH